MNNVIKISLIAIFAFGIIVSVPTETYAFGSSDDGGCCGGDQDDNGSNPPPDQDDNNPPPVLPADCQFLTASPTTLPHGGGNVTLNWASRNAVSASISGIGNVPVNGSRVVPVTASRTFVLTVAGQGTSDSCTASVTVQPAPQNPAECIAFTANPTTLPSGGGNVTLTWSTRNATSASISGLGTVAVNGSRVVNVTANRTFTLTVVGAGGNDSCSASVTVASQPNAPVCEFLRANKTVVSRDGEDVTLSWNTRNATSVSISGVGSVGQSGSRNVFVNSNRTFTLTASNTSGSDTCSVTITVQGNPPPGITPRCDYFRVDTDGEVKKGDRVTLRWATSNADDVRIEPRLGSVNEDGSEDVTIYDDYTTFTLYARNLDNGREATCTVSIRVDREIDNDDEQTPRCDLEVSRTRVNRGDRVTLSWDTSNADRVRITDDRGNTIVNTTKSSLMDGEIDVVINQTTEFTLNARGEDGGSRTCRVEVKTDDLAVYEKRDQGLVIALTQVPYTGFEAGPMLTAIFYGLLTLWALFVAYILVIKKSSVLGFSLYKNTGVSQADLEHRKKVEALVAKYTGRGL